jgi:UDP-N-acetylmuramoyl-tripeptide--D-alanyl-D-alanine ligase
MTRISLNELIAATGGTAVGFEDGAAAFARVAIDSRTVRRGELFWALRGPRFDGHDFAAAALKSGAAACVVSSDFISVSPSHPRPLVVVDNTLSALWGMARRRRSRRNVVTIGVTGSIGKTTTRAMIHAVLNAGFVGMQSPHNYNNHIGLPLTILEIDRDHQFAVLELAASHVGEIRDLAELAAPEIGVVTGIGPAHLDGFGSEEQIIKAKGELLGALPAGGLAVLNGDDPAVRGMAWRAGCRVIFVGTGRDCQVRPADVRMGNNQLEFQVDHQRYRLDVAGRHHITAALSAIAIAREFGMSSRQIAAGLSTFVPPGGRCQAEDIGPWTVINDTYNASPRSMQAACSVLEHWQSAGKKVLVVGDMLELGPQSAEYHRQLGRTVAQSQIDYLLAYGCQAEHVVHEALNAGMDAHRLAHPSQFDGLLEHLDRWLTPGAVVLIKGSRGMRMERVVEWLRRRASLWKETSAGATTPALV